MPASRIVRKKTQIYAQTLFEFASAAGTEAQAMEALGRFLSCVEEVRTTVLALCELGKPELVAELPALYGELADGKAVLPEGEAAQAARILHQAAVNEGHEQRVRRDMTALSSLTPEVAQLLGYIGTGADRRLIPGVVSAYEGLVYEKGATVPVAVTTAVPLDQGLRARIESKMTAELKRPVYLMETVDPSIIGGVVIAAGDDVRDASVRTQLEHARRVLTTSTVFGGDGK